MALAGFGAYHGVNPAMGWLFAVSLGLQGGSLRAVYGAFIPIALGHIASLLVVVAAVVFVGFVLPLTALKIIGAAIVIVLGIYKLIRPHSHPHWVRMRVGFHHLTLWSFLMAMAHGAGLMLLPILLSLPLPSLASSGDEMAMQQMAQSEQAGHAMQSEQAGHAMQSEQAGHAMQTENTEQMAQSEHAEHIGAVGDPGASSLWLQLLAVGVHTGAMFVVMAITAVVIYDKVGLAILRRAWFNMERVWAISLLVSGAALLIF